MKSLDAFKAQLVANYNPVWDKLHYRPTVNCHCTVLIYVYERIPALRIPFLAEICCSSLALFLTVQFCQLHQGGYTFHHSVCLFVDRQRPSVCQIVNNY